MYVSCSVGGLYVANTCTCCAERRMLSRLRELSRRQGNSPSQFVSWTHRKFGEMRIERTRADGIMGTSLPCVICRKALDRIGFPWCAHINDQWVSSRDEHVPASKPTQKQRMWLKNIVGP